ncbi:hypothetical protein PTKIN_Ptkin02bG0151700 [Pterospermum kingtungense]
MELEDQFDSMVMPDAEEEEIDLDRGGVVRQPGGWISVLYLFQFFHEVDLNRVLAGSPWVLVTDVPAGYFSEGWVNCLVILLIYFWSMIRRTVLGSGDPICRFVIRKVIGGGSRWWSRDEAGGVYGDVVEGDGGTSHIMEKLPSGIVGLENSNFESLDGECYEKVVVNNDENQGEKSSVMLMCTLVMIQKLNEDSTIVDLDQVEEWKRRWACSSS